MKKKLIIVGCGGHAKVALECALSTGQYQVVGFSDDFTKGSFKGYKILGSLASVKNKYSDESEIQFFIAVGENHKREKIFNFFGGGISCAILVHPTASVAATTSIGEGTIIMANAVIESDAAVGKFCILNTNSSLNHDCVMGDFASLAPGVNVGGNCMIGKSSAICIGASISHGKIIGESSVIGGHSFVNSDIPEKKIAFGVPCKIKRARSKDESYL